MYAFPAPWQSKLKEKNNDEYFNKVIADNDIVEETITSTTTALPEVFTTSYIDITIPVNSGSNSEVLKEKVKEVELSVETLVKAVLQAKAAKSAMRKRDMIRKSSVQLMALFKQTSEVHDRAKQRRENAFREKRRVARAQLRIRMDEMLAEVKPKSIYEVYKEMKQNSFKKI